VLASPAVFEKKLSARHDPPKSIGLPLSRQELEQKARLSLQELPTPIGRYVTATGAIPRETEFESVDAKLLREIAGRIEPDPLHDDQSLILEAAQGLVVVLGCCHAGPDQHPAPGAPPLAAARLSPFSAEATCSRPEAQIAATIDALRREFASIESFR
jgi:hypothetical protein